VSPLAEARLRTASPARAEFEYALKQPNADELSLVVIIGAEERHADDIPSSVVAEVNRQIDELSEAAETRMKFDQMLGATQLEAAVPSLAMEYACTAVSTTLFGSGAPDDGILQQSATFYGSQQFYDPANSYVDQVLMRRSGLPLSLSLVYKACTERIDTPLVGLNAPGHLLLAPARDTSLFAVDPFVGELISADQLQDFVGERLPPLLPAPLIDSFVQKLLKTPMNRFDWVARCLRNLRQIHTASGDLVRLLGCSERLLLVHKYAMMDEQVAKSSSPPVPRNEVLQCEREVAMCLYKLRDTARAAEARAYLQRSIEGQAAWEAQLSDESKAQVELLLSEPYFHDAKTGEGFALSDFAA